MISEYSYKASGEADMQISGVKTKKVEKGLKRLLVIASIILAAQLIWLFIVSPFIPFTTIDINYVEGLSRVQILNLAGIDDTSSFMSTNVLEVQERISSHILVESARVSRRFPDRLIISVIPRRAAAAALSNINGRQLPLYIDNNGVFFKFGSAGRNSNLPIISGLENPQIYMQLPASLVPLMENLALLSSTSPQLLSLISEIRIERKLWDGFELVLYPVHSTTRVRIENNLTEDVLRYMLLMLNVFDSDSNKPDEIDFRSGMGSFILQGRSLW